MFKNPKYVYPGEYAKDRFVTRTYKEGQELEVKVRSLETIKGSFEHALLQLSGFNTGPLHSSKNRMFNIKLVLPKGLTCGKAKYLGNLLHVINARCNGGGQWVTTGVVMTTVFQ